MHVLALRHAPLEGIGSIARALKRHHIECRTADLYKQPGSVLSLDDVAGLIVMGGPMSANDDLAWLRLEIDAIGRAIERGIPVLGICLGAQLMARALGARVYRNPEKEIGWCQVHWTDAGRSDALFGGCAGTETVFQWHGETFDVPAGAELLAYSGACHNQAFRAGPNLYAIQFHLEATPEVIGEWLRQDAACGDLREAVASIDPYARAARMAELSSAVFGRWCALLP